MPVFHLSDELVFPNPKWTSPEGLLAIGGDLAPERLLLAYQLGIFPWYSAGEPVLWWSPDPRCVLFPAEIHVSRRLAREIRKCRFRVTCNQAFPAVLAECANSRTRHGEETWLTREMQEAYQRLHDLGFAHSIEAWDGIELAGGLYGVGLGRVFFGESMFHRVTNASKTVLVALAQYLKSHDFLLLDCQVPNGHLKRMGARPISRDAFLGYLEQGGLGPQGRAEKVALPDLLRPECAVSSSALAGH